MFDEKTPQPDLPTVVDAFYCGEQFERPAETVEETTVVTSRAYRVKMGRVPIWLPAIEYRILNFLAATPYRAYTRRRIAQAASTEQFPVFEETVDDHIDRLRDRLGFFRSYIQSVPYIGYRFKA